MLKVNGRLGNADDHETNISLARLAGVDVPRINQSQSVIFVRPHPAPPPHSTGGAGGDLEWGEEYPDRLSDDLDCHGSLSCRLPFGILSPQCPKNQCVRYRNHNAVSRMASAVRQVHSALPSSTTIEKWANKIVLTAQKRLVSRVVASLSSSSRSRGPEVLLNSVPKPPRTRTAFTRATTSNCLPKRGCFSQYCNSGVIDGQKRQFL